MKRYIFPLIAAVLILVFYLWSPFEKENSSEIYMEKEGHLLLPQRNVAIVVLDLNEAGLSFTDAENILSVRSLDDDFTRLEGVTKVESILSASRVISMGEDIFVRKAIPPIDGDVTDLYMNNLASEIPDFPELTPYINSDLDMLLFYIYYANKTPTQDIYIGLKELQEKWADIFPFEFTGKAPILAETESLLTGDIMLFFPLLMLMVIAVFSIFKSVKAVFLSIVLIVISVTTAYGFVHFLGIPDSPLLLLIPVFSLGLLSDYLIHYFYHQFHTPRLEGERTHRKGLLFPLSLTALSTLTGFLSLSLIKGSGHLQLGILIAAAVVVTWFGVFFWLDLGNYPPQTSVLWGSFQKSQGRLFAGLVHYRYTFFIIILGAVIWGGIQLTNLSIEPYPIQQLPDSTTIKKADTMVNENFFGTLPFFIEMDTGEKNGILKKSTLVQMDKIHKRLEEEDVGYAFSMLTVLKRMNYYFMGSEETLLSSTEFDDFYDALIEQYLLYYSSSVDPLEYESLLDSSYRVFSIKGLIYYHNYKDLNHFISIIDDLEKELPQGWSLSVHGMVKQLETEQSNLRNNWVFSFLGGSFLIFITVLLFYKKLTLAFLSLIPGVISMVISFGLISIMGISIDAFSIIFVAIITGLVIDYSIHTLGALDQLETINSLEEGFSTIVGYSGIPIFLSFLTSLLSFSVLFLSSFSGARNLGFLLLTSLILSFFLSLYLIPLIILPIHLKMEQKND